MIADEDDTACVLAPDDYPCQLMAAERWTLEKCRAYARSLSESCRACPAKPPMNKVSDPFAAYEREAIINRPVYVPAKPVVRENRVIVENIKNDHQASEVRNMSKQRGTCTKCDGEDMVLQNKKGECQECAYGSRKHLTRDQVMEKKQLKGGATAEQPPEADDSPQPAAAIQQKQPIAKKTKTATCFFCAEEREHLNTVGDIKFNDGKHERNIHVCHYCASESLQEVLAKFDQDALPGLMGDLMYRRALDSRA